ncbi:MAG: hypothetical protein KAT48_05110 [Bacteroidales bacterium]|nr:hypothetical protein [Bacteroidales bacterium]
MFLYRLSIFTLFLFLFSLSPGYSQTNEAGGSNGKVLRVELETKQDSEPYTFIPFGNKGVVVFYESVVTTEDRDHTIWVFQFYDVNLRQVWIQELPVLKGLEFHKSDIDFNEGLLYLMFYNDKKSYSGDEFQIVLIPGNEGTITAQTGKLADKAAMTHFEVFGNLALIGAHTQKKNAHFYIYNMEEKSQQKIDLNLQGLSFLMDIYVDTVYDRINIIFKDYIEKQGEQIFFRSYDYDWNSLSTIEINNDERDYLINGADFVPVNENESIIIGTYKDNQKGKYEVTTESDINFEATGFYIAKLLGDTNEFIKYHDFSKFNSFYKNLSVSDLSRIRKKDKNSEGITIDYNLLVHNTIPLNDTFVFIAEAYYPEYHTITRMMYDWYGRPIPSYYNVFDGYRYTSVFIAGFDKNGNLLWDNGLELWDILTFKLEKRVNVVFDKEETVIAYSNNGEVTYKVISGSKDVFGVDNIPIESRYPRDRLISESSSNMVYWYKNYFLTYGYQRIKNNTLTDQNRRYVFYFNKIAFN